MGPDIDHRDGVPAGGSDVPITEYNNKRGKHGYNINIAVRLSSND
jgi:hypothetical protein